MADLIVTIDGPAGSGKSTVARLLAKKLNAGFLDTGAMYRTLTLAAMQANLDLADSDNLLEALNKMKFSFIALHDGMSASIDSEDVTQRIRQPDVTANAKYIANAPKLREKLVTMQRDFAANHKKIVTEGRDQGTVAFPNASFKFYLTAHTAERARRRLAELHAKGHTASLDEVQTAIETRDKSDQNRSVGPLKPADDAIIIDTTNLSVEQVVEKLFEYVKNYV